MNPFCIEGQYTLYLIEIQYESQMTNFSFPVKHSDYLDTIEQENSCDEVLHVNVLFLQHAGLYVYQPLSSTHDTDYSKYNN